MATARIGEPARVSRGIRGAWFRRARAWLGRWRRGAVAVWLCVGLTACGTRFVSARFVAADLGPGEYANEVALVVTLDVAEDLTESGTPYVKSYADLDEIPQSELIGDITELEPRPDELAEWTWWRARSRLFVVGPDRSAAALRALLARHTTTGLPLRVCVGVMIGRNVQSTTILVPAEIVQRLAR